MAFWNFVPYFLIVLISLDLTTTHGYFTDKKRIHPKALSNLDEGDDIAGVAGHVKLEKDGQEHFHVSIWPGGIVPYVITGGFKFSNARKRIKNAFEEYHRHTCIRFVPRKKETTYLNITGQKTGSVDDCSSTVGHKEDGPQMVKLSAKYCGREKTLIHELMHAIGFSHEQNRPDRDQYIEVHMENLINKKFLKNFEIKPDLFQDVGVPYDIGSVMQYSEESRAKPNTKTMISRNGKILGNKKGFSLSDIKEINRLYQCEGQE